MAHPERDDERLACTETCTGDPVPPLDHKRSHDGDDPVTLDRYAVESEHARGGIGRVLRARDLRFDRPVALKELLVAGDQAELRFIREAHLTARLQHPSIVPVYELSTRNGRPFYAMKFITGRTLKQLIEDAHDLDARLSLLPNVLAVADAIAYAHSNRVVHRDIKPSNVVVGAFGETIVIDWGLAKDLSEPSELAPPAGPYRAASYELTVEGSIVGTPSYMPPEQAAGASVDERADVYALGALLYHVLAGVPPYRGATPAEVLAQVLAGPPPPLAHRQKSVPADLAAIVAKAMARDPAARYADGSQLAADLHRFQTGQMVQARTYTGLTLAARWASRNRLPLSFVAMLAVAGTIAVWRVVRERDRAEARGNELVLAQARAWLDRDPTTAVAWLKHHPLGGGDAAAVRDIGLEAAASGVARHVFHRANTNSFAAFSPDGSKLATAGDGETIEVRDVASGAVVRSLPYHGLLLRIAFLDADRIVFVDTRRVGLHVWDLRTGTERVILDAEGEVRNLVVSADGRLVATANADGTVRLFDLAVGAGRVLGAHPALCSHVRFSPDARWLSSIADDHSLYIWDLANGTHRSLADHGDVARTDFSPDGGTFVASGVDGVIHVWSLGSGEHRVLRGHDGFVWDVRFSHDGRWLVSAGNDRTVRLWDWQRGTSRILRGHTDMVLYAMFSPDDTLIASASRDETVRLWSTRSSAVDVLRGHSSTIFDLGFSADGRWLYSNALDHTVRVWPISEGPIVAASIAATALQDVAFVGSEEVIAGGVDGVRVRLADGAVSSLTPEIKQVARVVVAPDGSRAVAMVALGRSSLYELATGGSTQYDTGPAPAWAAAFAPDGKTVAFAVGDGTVRLWQPDTGVDSVLRAHAADTYSVAYSSDGRWLASAGADGAVHVWDTTRGMADRVLVARGPRMALVAFASDRPILAAVDWSGRLHVWDLERDRALVLDSGRRDRLITVAFQPHGEHLAVAGDSGDVQLWTRDGRLVRTLHGHRGVVQHVVFSPDGALLASASDDHTVRVWDAESGAELRVIVERSQVRRVAFSADSALLAIAARQPIIEVWRVRGATGGSDGRSALGAWLAGLTTAETNANTITRSP